MSVSGTDPKNLKLFVWNDEAEQMDGWKKVFDLLYRNPEPTYCEQSNADEVAKQFAANYHDCVVLDIIERQTGHAKGLDIAKRIRAKDPYVPVIAVTRYPELTYPAADFVSCGLAGVFHDSIVERNLFPKVAIRQSMDLWHALFREHVMVRRALSQIDKAFRGTLSPKTRGVIDTLRESLLLLPPTASIESWHRELCKGIASSIEQLGYREWAFAYRSISSVFAESDPFYMASTRGRRHLAHNVQSFLLGLNILLEPSSLLANAMRYAKENRGEIARQDLLVEVLLVWASIATTHDVAYMAQDMEQVTNSLERLCRTFKPLVESCGGHAECLAGGAWSRWHHAKLGGAFWRSFLGSMPVGCQQGYVETIAKAIERHDSKCPDLATPGKVGDERWAEFLAVLCDELQDWHRERHEAPPGTKRGEIPWRLFALESFDIQAPTVTEDRMVLDFRFVIRDYDEIVKSLIGTAGILEFRERLESIRDSLVANLKSSVPIAVNLVAEVTTRDNASDVVGFEIGS